MNMIIQRTFLLLNFKIFMIMLIVIKAIKIEVRNKV